MLENILILAKIFTGHLVGRLIIASVRFFLIYMFAPESLSVYLAEKTDFPYAIQIFCLAMTIIATLILDKVSFCCMQLIFFIQNSIKKRNTAKKHILKCLFLQMSVVFTKNTKHHKIMKFSQQVNFIIN